jgi:hypothetical protein
MTVKRGRSVDSGRTVITQQPTFTESLLMEILIQVMDHNASDDYIKKALFRAGFTEEEIKERLG